jgi:predicted transcriptional regulator
MGENEMKKILISIKPEFVQSIINGTKKYEYRTKVAKQNINSLIIYSTYPKMKVVAEVEVVKVLKLSPKDLWKETKNKSGITETFFNSYFMDRQVAYAYQLGEVNVYKKPKPLLEIGVKSAPQSFIYI